MLKVYVIFLVFFVKAVKKIIIDSLHSASLILGCFCGFGSSFKDKVDEIVLFTEFSMAAVFAVCFLQKCIWGQTIVLCPRMGRELFRLPSAKTQSICCSSEVGSSWGFVSPWHFAAICGGWAQSHSVWAELTGVGMALSLSSAPLQSFDFPVNTICIPPSQDMSKGSLPRS